MAFIRSSNSVFLCHDPGFRTIYKIEARIKDILKAFDDFKNKLQKCMK